LCYYFGIISLSDLWGLPLLLLVLYTEKRGVSASQTGGTSLWARAVSRCGDEEASIHWHIFLAVSPVLALYLPLLRG
jgi:hypothetical protein